MVATRSLGELTEAAVLLAAQPLPAGRRVAIVSDAAAPCCRTPPLANGAASGPAC